jgi:hypothetical protein
MGRKKQRGQKPKSQITVSDTPLIQAEIAAQTEAMSVQIMAAAVQGILIRNSAFDAGQAITAGESFGQNYHLGMARTDYIQHSDKNLTMMINAAALSAPDTWIHADELPAPYGICVFEEPIKPEPMYKMPESISAISWGVLMFRSKNSFGQRVVTSNGIIMQIAWGLRGGKIFPMGMMSSGIGRELDDGQVARELLGDRIVESTVPLMPSIIRSLSALNRSPLSVTEFFEPSAEITQKARLRGVPRSIIRRSYLRKPEQGRLELNAAVDNLYGRATRGHWVRGFWRQQWYPSSQEYRRIWIEGHARGDFSLGVVTGPKVLVGKGDVPEEAITAGEQ